MPRPGYEQTPLHRARRITSDFRRLNEQVARQGVTPELVKQGEALFMEALELDRYLRDDRHRAAASQARTARIRAQRARNALPGQAIDDAPTTNIPVSSDGRHEITTGYHTHAHVDGQGGIHTHEHFHRADNEHRPSRQPDHDADGAH